MYASVLSANDSIRLWVDKVLVADTTQALSVTEASGTVNFASTHTYYGINIEYKHLGGIAGAQMKWLNAAATKVSISTEYLFFGIDLTGSPFALLVKTVLLSQAETTRISPEFTTFVTSVNASITVGSSVSIMAGMPLSLSISVVDGFGNFLFNLCSGQPGFFCPAYPFSIFAVPEGGNRPMVSASASYLTSTVSESLTLTKSGIYNIFVHLLNQSGLKITGQNACDSPYTSVGMPVQTHTDQNGIFDATFWSNISAPTCLKFTGVFYPPQTGQLQFYLGGFAAAQLQIGNGLLAAVQNRENVVTDFLNVDSTSAYSIDLDVEVDPNQDFPFILWRVQGQNEFLPIFNKYFFSGSTNIAGSPFRLIVVPSHICASTSMIQGTGATLSFISRISQFNIVAKDEYSNRMSSGGQIFLFSLKRNITSVSSKSQENISVITNYNLNDFQNGKYSITYFVNETAEMPYTLYTKIPGSSGLQATYYVQGIIGDVSQSQDICVLTKTWNSIDFSSENISVMPASLPKVNTFKVRWAGFVQPQYTATYTLYAKVTSINESIRIWIDNALIMNMWSNVSEIEGSGTIAFNILNGYYEMTVEYMHRSGSIGAQLGWQSTSLTRAPLPSSLLFQQWSLYGTPTALHVHGFWTYISLSMATVAGGTQVSVNGYGFDQYQNYTLLLSGNDTAQALPVYPVSNNILVAYIPSWNSDNNGLVNVSFSADGKDFVKLYADNQNMLLSGRLESLSHIVFDAEFCFAMLSYLLLSLMDCTIF